MFALSSKSEKKHSPCVFCHLDYISQFTSDTYHIPRMENVLADALSHLSVCSITSPAIIHLSAIALNQLALDSLDFVSEKYFVVLLPFFCLLQLKVIFCVTCLLVLLCFLCLRTMSVPFFYALRSLSHPGITATVNLTQAIFFRPDMYHIITTWSRSCVPC